MPAISLCTCWTHGSAARAFTVLVKRRIGARLRLKINQQQNKSVITRQRRRTAEQRYGPGTRIQLSDNLRQTTCGLHFTSLKRPAGNACSTAHVHRVTTQTTPVDACLRRDVESRIFLLMNDFSIDFDDVCIFGSDVCTGRLRDVELL